jgi:hypothetical protein
MKKKLIVVMLAVASCVYTQTANATELSLQGDGPALEQIISLGHKFVTGERSVRDIAIRDAQASDPNSLVGTALMSRDGSYSTFIGNIKVGRRSKTAVFRARLFTFGVEEANDSGIRSGNVKIYYEKRGGVWRFRRISLVTDAVPNG